jgi:hypothetical protein
MASKYDKHLKMLVHVHHQLLLRNAQEVSLEMRKADIEGLIAMCADAQRWEAYENETKPKLIVAKRLP